jgi:hypothetical protein
MKIRSHFSCFALAGTLSAALGCGILFRSPEYSIGGYNDTATQIADSRVDWQSEGQHHHEDIGILSPREGKLYGQEPRPLPDKATLRWTTSDGAPHRQEIEIAKLIADPPKFSGTIYFKFTADGRVIVIPLTYDEQERLATEHKKYP